MRYAVLVALLEVVWVSTMDVAHATDSQPMEDTCTCIPYYLCNNDKVANKSAECDHYLDTCCLLVDTIQSTNNTHEPQAVASGRNNSCGIRNFEVIGYRNKDRKNEAEYGEFPWMAAVLQPDPTLSQQRGKTTYVYQCGGSLIHPWVVLTGAHCVRGKGNLVVRLGEWDTQSQNELYPTQDRNVSEVMMHDQFNNGSLANDIALLVLEKPVDMSVDNVGLICLPEPNENMDGRSCVTSGWGKDKYGKEGNYSELLKRGNVKVIPKAECQQALKKTHLGNQFMLDESLFCAGGPEGNVCQGDGGSPLACLSRSNPVTYVLAGTVAWGVSCGSPTPSAFVKLSLFVDWINGQLQKKNISF